MKLIENSVIYAAKLNEPAQWLNRPEEIIDIHSENFKTVISDNVKDKNLGKVIFKFLLLSLILLFLVCCFDMPGFAPKSQIFPRLGQIELDFNSNYNKFDHSEFQKSFEILFNGTDFVILLE